MSEIEDRRQRAREAAKESHGDPDWFGLEASGPVNAAIEVATQVKITREAVSAFRDADVDHIKQPHGDKVRIQHRLAAALTALGFEVVEIEDF